MAVPELHVINVSGAVFKIPTGVPGMHPISCDNQNWNTFTRLGEECVVCKAIWAFNCLEAFYVICKHIYYVYIYKCYIHKCIPLHTHQKKNKHIQTLCQGDDCDQPLKRDTKMFDVLSRCATPNEGSALKF